MDRDLKIVGHYSKRPARLLLWVIGFLAIACFRQNLWGYNCQSNAVAGNWSAAGSWTSCNGTTPQAGDTVLIRNGHTITLNASPTISSITIQGGGVLNDDNGGRTLTLTTTTASGAVFTIFSNGVFNPGNSTVRFNGNGNITLTNGLVNFYNLTFSPTVAAVGKAYTFGSSSVTINNSWDINPTAASALALTVNLASTTVVIGTTTIRRSGSATSTLTTTGSNWPLSTGWLNVAANGTLNANASQITLTGTGGTLFTRGGTFTAGTSTVTFAPDANVTLTSNAAITFYNLVLAPTLTADRTYTFGTTAPTINGDFTINPDKSDAGNARLTVNMGAAITVAATKLTTIGGTGNAFSTLDTMAGSNWGLSTGRLDLDTNGELKGQAAQITITGTTGLLWTHDGTYTYGTSTVTFNGNADVTLTAANAIFYNLNLAPTITAPHAYTFGTGAVTVNNLMTINPGTAANLLTVYMGGDINVASTMRITRTTNATSLLTTTGGNYALSAGYINITAGATFTANASSVTLTGTSGTLFTNAGTFNANTSTVAFTSDATVTLTSNNAFTFYHLVLAPTISADRTYTFGTTAPTIKGDFTINPAKFTDGNNTLTVNLGAATTVNAIRTITIKGTGNALSNLSTVANWAINAGGIDIQQNGTLTANAATITLYGTPGPLFSASGNGNFVPGTSNVTISTNADATLTEGNITFNNLNLTPLQTAPRTYTFGNSTITVNGTLTINPGNSANLLTVNLGADITVLGTLSITRTTASTSLLDTTAGNFKITAGLVNIAAGATLNANGSTITLKGTAGTLFTRAGTFNAGTSNVVMQPDAAVTIFSGASSFYDLTFAPALTASRIYTMGAAAPTINHDFTINPSASDAFSLTANMGAAVVCAGTVTVSNTGSASSTLNTVAVGNALTAGRVVVDPGNTLTLNAASPLTLTGSASPLLVVNGIFNVGTSALTVNTDNSVTISSGVATLNAVTFSPTLTMDQIYTMGDDLTTINGNFTINPTKATAGDTTLTVNMSTDVAMGAAYTLTVTGTTNGYSVFDSQADPSFTLTAGKISIGTNGTFNANGSTITLTATTSTLLTRTGVFNAGTSHVIMNPDAAVTLTSGAIGFYNWTLSPTITLARIYTIGAGPHTIDGNLIINPSAASALALTVNMGAGGLVIAPDKTLIVTRTNSATATLDATATNYPITAGHINIQAGGTLNGRSSQIVLNGTTGPLWNHAGTFTTTASTVTFNPDADVMLTNGAITFNHVQLAPTLTADRTYEMGTGDLIMNGFFTIIPDKSTAENATLTVNMGAAVTVGAAYTTILNGTGNAFSTLDTVDGSNYTLSSGRLDIRSPGRLLARAANVILTGTTGTLITNTGVFDPGESLVTITPNAAITLNSGAVTFYDLLFSPTITAGRTYTFGAAPVTILNNFTLNPNAAAQALAVDMGAPLVVKGNTVLTRTATATSALRTAVGNWAFETGTLSIGTGGTFTANASSITINGTASPLITRTGTFTQGTSTVTIKSPVSATLNSGTITFNHLVIDSPGQTETAGAAITVSSNMTILNGTLDDGGTQIVGSAGGRLIMAAGTGLNLGSAGVNTQFPTNFVAARIALDTTSTVTYQAGNAVAQNISGTPTYGNLVLVAPAGAVTKTAAALVVKGNLTNGTNNTFDVGAANNLVTIGGNYANNGAFECRAGTMVFNGTTAGLTISGNMTGTSDFNNLTFAGVGGEWTLNNPVLITSTLTVSAGTLLGAVDVIVSSGVVGNGTTGEINFGGGTFEHRVAADHWFGTNAAGSKDWTFYNLTFSNSSGANRTVRTSASGGGNIVVNGTLTIGKESDSNTTTLDNNSNDRIIIASGNVNITSRGVFQASNQQILSVGGTWSNDGTFTHNDSTVTFTGTGSQHVNNFGKAFANLVSSNTSAGGVIFSSSFSAAQLTANASDLNSGATLYFAAGSTFTISSFSVTGTAAFPIVLRSTDPGSYWHLNNTSTHTVRYAAVEDSNADSGKRIFDYPGGTNLGHNSNWAFGATPPTGLNFTDVQTTSLSLSWSPNSPPPDSYTLDISSNENFSAPATSSSTALTNLTTSSLLINTTYFARINSVIEGLVGDWSSTISTATLANAPATAVSTWTAVQFTSVTVTWLNNNNPLNLTQYLVQLSTVGDFLSGTILSSSTTGLDATFESLDDGGTYYAQVKAINHSNLSTNWLPLGSTVTLTPATPPNFRFTGAQTTSLTAAWDAPTPAGSSYTLQICTSSNFIGTVVSSATPFLFASNPSKLNINTTYYGRVNSINAGIESPWADFLTTATLANIPATAVSTFSDVGYSSLTVHWLNNNNPISRTLYTVEISTASNFQADDFFSSSTFLLSATFEDISMGATYFARVKAVNHSNIETEYIEIGSTKTIAPTTCNAMLSGNWDSPSTWLGCSGPEGLPAPTDAITLNPGVNVTLNINATVAGIDFAAPGANNSLTHLSTTILTVNGNVIFNQPTTDSRTGAWNINDGTATVTGLISFLGTNPTVTRVSKIVIASGELNGLGGISFAASDPATKVIDMSGGDGQLNLKGNLTIPANSCTLTAGTAGSVFNYMDDSNAQTVLFFTAGAYNNLHLNNTSPSGVTLDDDISAANVTANLRVQSGTFKNGGYEVAGGAGDTFEVADGATFEMSGTSAFPSGFGTLTVGTTSRIRYLQTSNPLTITAQTYGHLDLMPAGTASQNFPAGTFNVQGDLSIGDGTTDTTVSANANNTTLIVNGNVSISPNATFTAHASNPLLVRGDWTNNGTFTHNNSTVSFAGASTQYVNNAGKAFANLISSNTSSGGLVFSSSFSAAQLWIKTADLNSASTLYFTAGSTFAISTFNVAGSASYPVVLRSTTPGSYWFLNNTSTHVVLYTQVEDSNASTGRRIFNYPGGFDLGNNVNWAMSVNPPSGLEFDGIWISSFSVSWAAASPPGDTYTLEVSTDENFNGTLVSSNTTDLSAIPKDPLTPNTTYHAHVQSIISDVSSEWSSSISTVTLANIPATAVSTWTNVNFTSVTVNWLNNNNPLDITLYTVDIATASDFTSEEFFSSSTYNLNATFENLTMNTVYYGRVKATSYNNIETSYLLVGSTQTKTPTTCNATATGNWSDGTRWTSCTGPGGIPSPTDAVTINSAVTITLNVDATVAGLTFASPGTNNALTQLSTVTLTVNGPVTFNQPTTNIRNNSWNINAGTATVTGPISFLGNNATTTRISRIVITSGKLDALAGISFITSANATKQIVMSGGAGQLNLKGNLTIPANSCTLTAGTAGSVFNYMDDTNAQSVSSFTAGAYHNLYLNNTSAGGATLNFPISAALVTANLRVQSGTFKNGNRAIVGGAGDTFEVTDGATFEMSGTAAFPSGFSTFTFGPSSRVRYLQTSSPITISTQTFGHLDLMPAGTATQNFPVGSLTVQGDLSIGDGTTATTVSANANNTTLIVNGNVLINPNATFIAHASNPLVVGGDWTNDGTFTHNNSTVSFAGASTQYVNNTGKTFANLISSNTSSGGLIFSSSFSAAQLWVNTNDLNSAATIYFAAGSTFTISTFNVAGTASYPVVLRSTTPGSYWFLNNTSTHVVLYTQVEDSNASAGRRILNYPGGLDLGHNVNWAIGLNPPASLQLADAQITYISYSWPQASPPGDTYTLQVSTNDNFSAPMTSSSTALLNGTTINLSINTTYYARVNAVINGNPSSWSATLTTATLANIPATAVSTWTSVDYTSIALTWLSNGNPLNLTRYLVQLSTVSNFLSGTATSSDTLNLNATFSSLIPASTYYAQVKALNHSDISTALLPLGSTTTLAVNTPTGFIFSSATINQLSATWNIPAPPGDSYSFQVSTAPNFSGSIISSNTALAIATTTLTLAINTTYYGRVNAIINGSSSVWSPSLTTATLANAPSTAVSTWTAVHITSLTVAWLNNGNPLDETSYQVQLSTVSNFLSGTIFNVFTTDLEFIFDQLDTGTTYYGQVRSINHSGISTDWLFLGSTGTVISAIPKNLRFTSADTDALSAAWDPSSPPGDTYTLQVSTDSNFNGAVVSSETVNLFATTVQPLEPNTTYYAQVNATVGGIPYPWSAYITTATLANIPASDVSTWTAVNITSVTVAWLNNGNPSNVTTYQIQLATVSNFLSGNISSSNTVNLNSTFSSLIPQTTYFAQVRTINHSGLPTNWQPLGSTVTLVPNAPSNFHFTSAGTNNLSAAWDVPTPPGDTYIFQASTSSNFTGTLASSATANLFATSPNSLQPNTTYYGRVDAVVMGATSPWTASQTTATLANVPATAASTWTAVNLTSITVTWLANNNPTSVTNYVVQLSTVQSFAVGDIVSVSTFGLEATFELLETARTYYGRVKAVNHIGTSTDYLTLGSTQTKTPTTCNASATGNWDSAGTWTNCTGPGGLPSETDIITINSGITVTQNMTATIGGVIFAAPGTSNALTQLSTTTLTVNGGVTFNQPTTSSRNNSWNINDGTATVSGLISFLGNDTTTSRVSRIVINSGKLNAFGGITFTGSANATKLINMSGGAGQLNLKGNLTIPGNSCTLTAGTAGSIFNFMDDTNAQTVSSFTAGAYHNLYLNNTSPAGATLSFPVMSSLVTAHLRVQSGTFKNNNRAIVGGAGYTFEVDDGATFEMSGTAAFPSGFSTFTFGPSSRVRYLQTSSPITISTQTFGHLDLMPAGAATQNFPTGSLTVQGDLSIGNGTTATTVSANANNTTLIVNGKVLINPNASFTAHASNPLLVRGDWTNNGVFTHNNSTVSFAGASTQYVNNSGKAFANLISSNTSAGGLVFPSSFSAAKLWVNTNDLNSAATLYFAAKSTFTISTFSVSGTASYPVVLRSTETGTHWFLKNTSTQVISQVEVQDSNASSGLLIQADSGSINHGNNVNWDFGPPEAVDNLNAWVSQQGGAIDLTWTTPGDDGPSGTLNNSTFTIQYTTDTAFAESSSWSPTTTPPAYVYRTQIATNNVSAGTECGTAITNLISGGTYYFRIWTKDDAGNFAPISNGATNYVTSIKLDISLSTDTLNLGSLLPGATVVHDSSITVTNNGNIYSRIELSLINPADWTATTNPTGLNTFRLTGVFRDSEPNINDFDVTDDVITTTETQASSVVFALPADPESEKGIAIPPGEKRTLWIRIEMPKTSTTLDNQVIRLRTTAIQE